MEDEKKIEDHLGRIDRSETYHLKSFFKRNYNLNSLNSCIDNLWAKLSSPLKKSRKEIEGNIKSMDRVGCFNESNNFEVKNLREIYNEYLKHFRLYGTIKNIRKLRPLLRILFPNNKEGIRKGLYNNQDQFEDFLDTLIIKNKQLLLKHLISELLYHYPKDQTDLLFKRLRKIYCHLDQNKKSHQVFIEANRQFQLIDGEGPSKIAKEVMDTNKNLDLTLRSLWIGERHLSCGIGQEIVKEICSLAQSQNLIEDSQSLDRFLTYFSVSVKTEVYIVRYKDVRPIVKTLLGPFKYKVPNKLHKKKITKFLDQHVGDPRHKSEKWISMHGEKEIFLKWKIDETIKDFLELLSYTAKKDFDVNRMWKYRKEFIEYYWKENHISDAWIVLGRKDYENRDKFLKEGLHEYGQLISGGTSSHSALLFQIGDLIISEWNYNGKARIWKRSNRSAPKFYKQEYPKGNLEKYANKEVIHHYSEEYSWQRKMSDYIESYTGITCPEVLSKKFY